MVLFRTKTARRYCVAGRYRGATGQVKQPLRAAEITVQTLIARQLRR